MFDLVNARAIAMAVRDYNQVLREVARVLRPGGLFISCEWATYPAFEPSLQLDPAIHALPLLQRRGLQTIAPLVPSFLEGAGAFVGISAAQHNVPIGAWPTDPSLRSIGAACLQANVRYAESVKPFLLDSGWTAANVDTMVEEYVQEIESLNGLVSVLYTVHARRA
ncbi:hypothetical protein CPB84DRAFT_1779393 [Gymnopilus junonius]|uniref:Methyltransferase type 11 domain-containing protein n=1 Tax=Gymnopilus junonius TaxID=109634 RepID=A0A9P5TNM5_GYMJU|nr:hypothetical protein CPB84DRAFT_1779393 [Gymnopilus junonius]